MLSAAIAEKDMIGAISERYIAPIIFSCAPLEIDVMVVRPQMEEPMNRLTKLTHSRAIELFDYDPRTGNLLWKCRTSNVVKVGDVVGCVRGNGRIYTTVDGENHLVHRLVWLWHKGEFPKHHLAPINGDYLNTRIENLVEQTPKETVKKSGPRANNKAGVKGVAWDEEKQQYSVYAYIDGKSALHSRHRTLAAASVAAEEALSGILPSDDQRLKNRISRVAEKRMWREMLLGTKGIHRWESVEHFLSTVSAKPRDDAVLLRVDHKSPIGPDNFRWSDAGEELRSQGAIHKAAQRSADRVKYRDGHLRRKYKIGHEQYVAMVVAQKGVCAICNEPETEIGEDGRIIEFHVDHDRASGDVRGLLCRACNTAIGSLRHDVALMQSAIRYIEKWKGQSSGDASDMSATILSFGT